MNDEMKIDFASIHGGGDKNVWAFAPVDSVVPLSITSICRYSTDLTLEKLLTLCLLAVLVSAEDTPPGLISKDSEQDLLAEATQNGYHHNVILTMAFHDTNQTE
ncbi:hypothetical protein EVAR_92849_1 [Eumeta japonica]|uniref:Uncharacterized protein n=1 Tax=Eumeta variegata TaxID=151549 RepID=A0A4C1TCY6_EUMVA|nr:hypothetical protein EVAR_92849_1 [Eumeta japonica]